MNQGDETMAERILIVDDEQEIADLVALYLESENFEVRTFYSAAPALKCAKLDSSRSTKMPPKSAAVMAMTAGWSA